MLKGLHENENIEHIKQDLIDLMIDSRKFIKVVRLETRKSIKLNRMLPIYLVQVSPDSVMSDLYKINYLNNQVIFWGRLKKVEILQCKRCQRYGHAAPNCRMEYRCVKCDVIHSLGECAVDKSETNKNVLFCVLCKNYGHPPHTGVALTTSS